MKKLVLIDGHAIFYRAFHAMPLLVNSKNEYTNAIYGFMKMLFEIVRIKKPEYLAIAFDHKSKTNRHLEYAEYKAQRKPPPPELFPQMPKLQELLRVFNIPIFEMEGYEADDVLGTLATQASQKGDIETLIVTGDMDSFQLVNDHIFVFSPQMGMSKATLYDRAQVIAKMGLTPEQVIDYKALRGDVSDNIPGVPGIGDKQACELLTKYQTLENIYDHLSELRPGQQKKLTEGRESALFSKKLATIQRDVPVTLDLEACLLRPIPYQTAKTALDELEFKSIANRLQAFPEFVEPQPEEPSLQGTLF